MTPLEMCLSVGLALSLVAVLVLARTLPRRVASMMLADQAKNETRALAAKAALHAASSAEVASIVAPLRTLLEEREKLLLVGQANTTAAIDGEVARITAGLWAMLEWLAGFAHAQYAQANAQSAQENASGEPVETTRIPGRAPVSRERPSPRAATPAVAPPGSAPVQPAGPALVAAGYGRPKTPPLPPDPSPIREADTRRGATVIGLAPPDASGAAPPALPRRSLGSSPTMPSMQAPALPTTVEGRGDDRRQTGAP